MNKEDIKEINKIIFATGMIVGAVIIPNACEQEGPTKTTYCIERKLWDNPSDEEKIAGYTRYPSSPNRMVAMESSGTSGTTVSPSPSFEDSGLD